MRSVGNVGATGELAQLISSASSNGATIAKAVVASVESGGTLTAYVEGSTVATPSIRYLSTVHPVVGKHVWILKDGGVWLAFGSSAPAPVIAAYVKRGADQTITDNAVGGAQAINFNSSIVETDPAGMYSTANPTRLTAPAKGFYSISGSASFAGNATGYRECSIGVNGIAIAGVRTLNTGASIPWYGIASVAAYPLDVGDYVELLVKQNSGASLSIQGAGNSISPHLSVAYLGSSGA